jgi:hypothetical protein
MKKSGRYVDYLICSNFSIITFLDLDLCQDLLTKGYMHVAIVLKVGQCKNITHDDIAMYSRQQTRDLKLHASCYKELIICVLQYVAVKPMHCRLSKSNGSFLVFVDAHGIAIIFRWLNRSHEKETFTVC